MSIFRLSSQMAIAIGLAVIMVAVFSVFVGLVVPFVFHRLRWDAMHLSSRFVHFAMDTLSLFIYFEFLWFWQNANFF